ncbi:MAG: prepilin-type N-terminal cleavage/methylation domain-containing protein [Isosphaeraceae bacterium]|jgi:prepilin-type processing-associated H-X9-DG protein|nr:MAG: prepilin-type N-terminal cleavage/methylation domain-containing protein [Isosphaeraceae bacterium]
MKLDVIRNSHLGVLRDRGGVTIIELIVSLGVIGLLLALLLPAVQQAREAARRARCLSNLHQVGLATQSYVAQHGVFPANWGLPDFYFDGPGPLRGDMKEYSVFTLLLPHLDEPALFQAINFNLGITDPYWRPGRFGRSGLEANATVMSATLGVLLCPSDPAPLARRTGSSNYRANNGTDRSYISRDGPFLSTGGRPVRPASIRDGLSHTVAFSEKLRARPDRGRLDPRVHMLLADLGPGDSNDQWLAECANQPAETARYRAGAGLTWFISSLAQTNYNHLQEPNSPIPDCVPGGGLATPFGLFGARSNHPGGVHAAMCDGSARFVAQTIGRPVWRALGSRDGGEAINDGSY